MSRSVRRRGGEGRGDSGPLGVALPRQRRGAAPEGSESRGIAPGICLRSAKARRTGGTVRRMFRQTADLGMSMPSEGRARGLLGRDAPRGSTCLSCCCRRRQGATFRGISGLGEHDAEAFIFPRRRSAFAAESRPRREGAAREKCAERAETRRTRSAAPLEAWLWRRAGEFGGEVAPEHACRGQRIGACGRALRRGASAGCFLPDAFRRRAGVRQKTSRFPRRTSCRRAFP